MPMKSVGRRGLQLADSDVFIAQEVPVAECLCVPATRPGLSHQLLTAHLLGESIEAREGR